MEEGAEVGFVRPNVSLAVKENISVIVRGRKIYVTVNKYGKKSAASN
jgi:hypothetical protein